VILAMDWQIFRNRGWRKMSDSSSRNPLPAALFVVACAVGAWYFFRNFEVQGLDHLSVQAKPAEANRPTELDSFTADSSLAWAETPRDSFIATPVSSTTSARRESLSELPAPRSQNLRIATWALSGLGPEKVDSAATLDRVASVISGFDVIAVQQLRASHRDFVPNLLARASRDGRKYDYLIGPTHETSGEQLAFFFDTTRVVTDRTQLYTVADPDQRMIHDPLVAWFRASEPEPSRAWTFSFVNVRIELAMARQETAELARILAAVARDGRGEDDCLMGGLFQADDAYLAATLRQSSLKMAIKRTPTDIIARHQTSNLIYSDSMTTEAIGRGGVFDFLRRENLSLADAEQVSTYLPVYAEFSPLEGGR
jgi:hypothetical protein